MKPFVLQLFGSAAPILKVGSEEAPNPLKVRTSSLISVEIMVGFRVRYLT